MSIGKGKEKMKKINRTYINKRWQKGLGIICLLGLILASVVFMRDSSQEKKEVSAHPTNTISLGSGEKQFEVPVDGAEHLEYPSSYSGYQQLDMNIPSLGKQLTETESAETTLFSSQVRNSILKSYITSHGNIISMQYFTSHPYGVEFPYINQTRIILQSRTGEVLDHLWVNVDIDGTPNNINQSTSSDIETAYNSFFQKSGTEFMAIYTSGVSPLNTTTYIDEGTHLSVPDSDNRKRVDLSTVDMKGQRIENCWLSDAKTNMSFATLYPSIDYREAYVVVEHLNGQVLDRYEFEATPDAEAELIGGSNFQNYANMSNMYPISDSVVFGTEVSNSDVGGLVTRICKWEINPVTKKASRTEIARLSNTTISFEPDISDKNKIIAQIYKNTSGGEIVEIVEIDVNTLSISTPLRTLPSGTRFRYSKQGSGYIFVGQVQNISGELEDIGSQPGFYSGYMDADFNWKSASFIPLNFPEGESTISISSFTGNEDIYTISGSFATREISFIDKVEYGNYPGEISSGVNKEWSPQDYSSSKGNSYVSILKKTDDWSPLIKPPETFTVDSRDSDVDDPDILDRWLLTGSKNGNLTDSKSVQVYDTIDIDKGLFIYGIDWLRERINKNPKSLEYETDNITLKASDPIDWVKLGFDKNKAGAQLVTYFVTDSQNQTSSASTYVNNLLDTTVTDEEQDYALDAKNFHVPLSGIETTLSSTEKLKKLAKTMAWNLTNNESGTGEHGNGLDEDGASDKFSTSKVEVNTAQLTALQSATVAKPYPVDITYKPEAGIEITNRIWVFVTTDNTVADTETGVVYYADDYTIPYYSRGSHDLKAILDHGNIKAYNYYAKDTTAELTSLPDKTGGSSNWSISNLTDIHDPFSGGSVNLPTTVQPQLTYTWNAATDRYHTNGETTSGSLDVTLTGDVLLHIRQVIKEPIDELVVPTEGYLTVQTTLQNGGSPTIDPNYQSQVTVTSGKKGDDPSFTAFALSIEQLTDEVDQVNLTSVIPEFYQYKGYYASNEKASHGNDALNAPNNIELTQSYLYEEGELWITLYLEPNGTNDDKPQPYSWDYKHNDLGKITE